MTRVLIVSHGHPEFRPGGAENVAYTLFEQLKNTKGVEALFLARTGDPSHRRPGTHFSTFFNRSDEILLHSTETDPFLFSQLSETLLMEFAEFIEQWQPDVAHFHHYYHLGLELLAIVRRVCPSCRIVLTLHEYLAICNHHGQMVKTGNYALCTQATPADCARCFSDVPSTAFFMRQLFIQAHFDKVDLFIAPSEFLRKRYVEWGVPEKKMVLLKYLLPTMERTEPRAIVNGEKRSVFAFFGQLTPYKGLRVLVEAFELLEEWEDAEKLQLLIFGTQPIFPPEFVEWFDEFLKRRPQRISYQGPYGREDVPRLMASIDWVVVPSEWWENSPIVIEEAFAHGRPVICSDIGGMAEKVDDGVNGLFFQAGNPHALAAVIRESVTRPSLWDELTKRIDASTNRSSEIQDYLHLYE